MERITAYCTFVNGKIWVICFFITSIFENTQRIIFFQKPPFSPVFEKKKGGIFRPAKPLSSAFPYSIVLRRVSPSSALRYAGAISNTVLQPL